MPLPPPAPPAVLAERLRDCELKLPAIVHCARPCEKLWAYRGQPALQSAVCELRHPLSVHMRMPPFDLTAMAKAETLEMQIYQQWRRSLRGPLVMADVQRFVALCTSRDGDLRTAPVWIRAYDGRTQLAMVSAELASARWPDLLRQLAAGGLGNGMRAAVQLLALANNAHAFADGNGRLGRALFNFCLHRAGLRDGCYVPLKMLTVLSRGGYELRLREAELYGRWDGLYAYHSAAIKLYLWLGKQPSSPDQNEDV
ncbi:hypothetical protein NCPPB940_06540 [Xanthomonas hortorum pv. taraxaci]|nr:hypothetical protein NCPPB940_06540 [Xanthomonas hortorum pv. taraxaci]CAD0305665.1 hypothetical protein NCPPB940_06540 [Xanthomonas hortorum pv. taraxaci]